MYGKWVTLHFGDGFEVKVWVTCTPQMSDEELRLRALMLLSAQIDKERYVPVE